MRYFLLVLAVVIAGFFVFQNLRELRDSGPEESSVREESGVADTYVASGVYDPKETGPGAEESVERPPGVDPLAWGISQMLDDLVDGKFGEEDRPILEDRLASLLAESGLGDDPSRRDTAQVTVHTMVQQVDKARAAAGGAAANQQMREQAIQILSANFATDLYRRLPMRGGEGGAGGHAGTLSRAVEVDLPEGYELASWTVLGGFDYEEGMALPEAARALDGRKVGMTGYLMTLEEVEDIREFLLLESVWSCCFGIPAQLNQVILVDVVAEGGIQFTTWPILCLGRLSVGEEMEDGFVTSVYRLHAEKVLEVE
jgi:hypothetical protein